MNADADSRDMRQLAWWRWSAFTLGCGAFFLSFFHRVSTGAIAADLQREFEIGALPLLVSTFIRSINQPSRPSL